MVSCKEYLNINMLVNELADLCKIYVEQQRINLYMTDVGMERLVISQLVYMHHKSGYISLTGVKWTGGLIISP